MTADLVLFAVGWVAGWLLLWRVPVPSPRTGPAGHPSLSVIVPARNEEAGLADLLTSLEAELGVNDQLIVVDDHSDDATSRIARSAGATVIAAPEVPEGWNAKSWACHTGTERARRETLVFLDADTRLEAGGLDRLVGDGRAAGGLYSVQPWHRVPRPVEHLAALFNVVAMMGTGAFLPGRRGRPVAGAFGPCLVTSSQDYHTSGGFASVGGALLDDLALAERYRAAGLPVTIHGGRGTVSFRMYPAGLRQLVEGFTKNFAAGALAIPRWGAALVTLWLSALCAPGVLVASWPALALACYVAAAVQMVVHMRRVGSFGVVTALVYPLLLVSFVAVFLRSLAATFIRRRVRWKGRELTTRPGRTQAP